jgi:hypothetical protein
LRLSDRGHGGVAVTEAKRRGNKNGGGTKADPPADKAGGFAVEQPDNNLLSHWFQHYHRRGIVSRSCSGWEGVVPTRYRYQA